VTLQGFPVLHKFKARIEFVGDFEDVKKVKEFMSSLSRAPSMTRETPL